MSSDRKRPNCTAARWNLVFEVLAAEPRRQLVDALVESGESVSLPAAAKSPNRTEDFEQLRIQLRHQHLPLLESADYVEWQRDPFQASRGPRFEEVEAVLEALYANTAEMPDQLIDGCRTLERRRSEYSGG